ncbi:MAG: hypothetical protein K6B67_00800 [Lachnospiraceae bacterium]|nr:hypothetical protein [Lachnospiraceae bacterium]
MIKSFVEHRKKDAIYKKQYMSEAAVCDVSDYVNNNSDIELDLATIAFENPDVIDIQIDKLRKNLVDNYQYVVFDNSYTQEASDKIKEICVKKDVIYVKLPPNPYNGSYAIPSHSNGAAMNWVYYNYFAKRNSQVIGFIDHDIFLVKPDSVLKKLEKQKFWGVQRTMPSTKYGKMCCIYLWAGMCFYRREYLDNIENVDFMPMKKCGDTGAGNYYSLYYPVISTDEYLGYTFAVTERVQIEDLAGSPQMSMYEVIDDNWIHYLNASNWSKEDLTVKQQAMEKILN